MKYPHVAAIYLTKGLKITIWKVKSQEKKKVPQKQNYNMDQKEKKSHFLKGNILIQSIMHEKLV